MGFNTVAVVYNKIQHTNNYTSHKQITQTHKITQSHKVTQSMSGTQCPELTMIHHRHTIQNEYIMLILIE